MIYTLTMSAAVDLYIDCKKVEIGSVNRSNGQHFIVGGNGINVARMIKNFDMDSICLGFVGGFTGNFIEKELKKEKINSDFVKTQTPTRINVILNMDEKETNINSPSFNITEKEYNQLGEKLKDLKKGDILIITGSIPKDIPIDWLRKIMETAQKTGVEFILDLPNTIMLSLCRFNPLFVKPNKKELEDIFETKLTTKDDIVRNAQKLLKLGAKNVVVSLGEDGAVLVNEKDTFWTKTPQGQVIAATGSGDSLVGGFVAEYVKSKNLKKALTMGVICGAATAFSDGIANKEKIAKVKEQFID